jgi:hypothetical protein
MGVACHETDIMMQQTAQRISRKEKSVTVVRRCRPCGKSRDRPVFFSLWLGVVDVDDMFDVFDDDTGGGIIEQR